MAEIDKSLSDTKTTVALPGEVEIEEAVKEKIARERKLYLFENDPMNRLKYGGAKAIPGLLRDAIFSDGGIEGVRKNNNIAFDTTLSNDGASFMGEKFSFKVPTLNTTTINTSNSVGGNTSLINMRKAFAKAGYIDGLNASNK